MSGTLKQLDKLAEWNKTADVPRTQTTVAVRTKTLRRLLGIGKDVPLVYRGITLKPIGSSQWRSKNWSGDKA